MSPGEGFQTGVGQPSPNGLKGTVKYLTTEFTALLNIELTEQLAAKNAAETRKPFPTRKPCLGEMGGNEDAKANRRKGISANPETNPTPFALSGSNQPSHRLDRLAIP